MSTRIATSKVLLIQYGPTMTLEQFKGAFMPGMVTKTIRNKVSRGDLPPMRGDVFDSQEIGDWWESISPNPNAPPTSTTWRPGDTYAGVVAAAKACAIHAHQKTVYLLLKDDEVVYVGMSTTPFVRLSSHVVGDKDFDSVAMIQCDKDNVLTLEATLITTLRPKYNIAGMPREA